MEQSLLAIADTLQVLGDVIVALVVLSVHMHIRKERAIDEDVLKYMKREQAYVLAGIFLIFAGYVIEMLVRF